MARVAARTGEPLAANCIAVTPGAATRADAHPLGRQPARGGAPALLAARVLTVAPHTVAADPPARPGARSSTFAAELDDADLS